MLSMCDVPVPSYFVKYLECGHNILISNIFLVSNRTNRQISIVSVQTLIRHRLCFSISLESRYKWFYLKCVPIAYLKE